LLSSIQLLRDVTVPFTPTGVARGVSGHTGAHRIDVIAQDNDVWPAGGTSPPSLSVAVFCSTDLLVLAKH